MLSRRSSTGTSQVTKRRNSTELSQEKERPSAERLSFAKQKTEALTTRPEIAFLTIGKEIRDFVQVNVPEKNMNVTIWIEGDDKQTLSFDIASIPKGDEMQNALEKIAPQLEQLVNQMSRWPDTLVIQTQGGDEIKQKILALAMKLLGVKEKKDLVWRRYQTNDGRKAVLAFSVKKGPLAAATEPATEPAALPPPPPPPPPASEIRFNEAEANRKQAGTWEKKYLECVGKGETRYNDMENKKPLTESDKAKRQEHFDNNYITLEVSNPDSPTEEALLTVWKQASSDDAGYKNTPLPEKGEILSWQNKKSNGETLSNSDIYFCQYRLAQQKRGVEPPALKSLTRQQAMAEDTQAVCNHLRFLKNTVELSGTWGPKDAEFYALLGTMNGSGPAFLVIDHREDLKIRSIESIELDKYQNITFRFSN